MCKTKGEKLLLLKIEIYYESNLNWEGDKWKNIDSEH